MILVTGETIPIAKRIGLRVVSENTETEEEWFAWAKRAFQSIYRFEHQSDSLLLVREKMFVN